MRTIFAMTFLGNFALLAMSIWPGMVEVAIFGFLQMCITLPLLVFWFVLVTVLAVGDLLNWPKPVFRRRWWGVCSAAVMFTTIGLLWFHVPQRCVFAFYSSDLRALVEGAPVLEYESASLNKRFGPYVVDEYGASPNGGVFFRTYTGPDGIGPDTMSYGFVYRPTFGPTPLGASHYQQTHLFGDWYSFAVSDD